MFFRIASVPVLDHRSNPFKEGRYVPDLNFLVESHKLPLEGQGKGGNLSIIFHFSPLAVFYGSKEI